MDVTAKYELIGLMAYPIRHSLSPEMQNKALEKAGLPFTYMAFEVDNDSFPGAIEGLKALNLQSKCNKKRSTHQLEYNFVSTQKPFPNDEYFLPTSYNKRA
ncbi:hypothetical protein OZG91_07470, partial [Escherichia coli]|nr:hypothetical protein [Escherichia coli]MCZ0252984.1 hypothetical protein [Escherichia coli]MCZ0316168.1 hypothetical protein [Escherichia coli]MCZ0406709.1 hypothetical protein [Escherichia coli]MCZ0447299.1 hypothetical protein [Escherichia coli]